jgi:hypothetical protein
MLRGSKFVVIERLFQLAVSCTPHLFAQVCSHPLIFCSNEELTAKIQLKAGGSHGYKSRPD